MRSSPPSPRPAAGSHAERGPRRARALPWLLSLGLHALVLAWWASLPEPPPRQGVVELEMRPIELVELPESSRPEVEEPEVEEPEVEEPPSERPPDEVTPAAPEPTPAPRRAGSSRGGEPGTDEPETGKPGTDEPETGEPSGAVALLGLRGGSRSTGSSTSLRPSLPPPTVGHGHAVRRVGSASDGGEVQRDGKPRSLAEAGFRSRRNGKLVFRDHTGRFTATLAPDGRVKFRDMPVAISRDPITGAARGIAMPGLAEGLRAASGQELYNEEKRRLLEETFELRLQMAVAFARDKMDRRLRSLYRELLTQWQDERTTEAERRKALFQRWDDCEELTVSLPGFSGEAASEIDELRRTTGTEARETIERFIRAQLPADSPQAYTDEELRRLNATRRSEARFAPYR
ncbi:hypothetical protein [Paraliomyxa miuraensis]|uniref:hypothetical protein n=1 Tax=Paraliomyxa miuraensis TaxID=376150 RepID=UPI0022500DB1|nr:hypothetical protein [Paraliomyxa miuraensis]MCX4239698.1 hypothetical protein [Paraliomyxa miuraensis]